jgi:hypothetical protein
MDNRLASQRYDPNLLQIKEQTEDSFQLGSQLENRFIEMDGISSVRHPLISGDDRSQFAETL